MEWCHREPKTHRCVYSCSHRGAYMQIPFPPNMWFQYESANTGLMGILAVRTSKRANWFQSGWVRNPIVAGSPHTTNKTMEPTVRLRSRVWPQRNPLKCGLQLRRSSGSPNDGGLVSVKAAPSQCLSKGKTLWHPPLPCMTEMRAQIGNCASTCKNKSRCGCTCTSPTVEKAWNKNDRQCESPRCEWWCSLRPAKRSPLFRLTFCCPLLQSGKNTAGVKAEIKAVEQKGPCVCNSRVGW